MTKPCSRQALCRARCCRFSHGSRECHSSTAEVFRRVSALTFHCSAESFPAERICPVFSKFDSPGINGWGTTLGASQAHSVEWLPEVCFAAVASSVQNTGAGKKTLTTEAADFPALIVSAPGLVLVQKAFCRPLQSSLLFFPSCPPFYQGWCTSSLPWEVLVVGWAPRSWPCRGWASRATS